jgi:hypothetical protein
VAIEVDNLSLNTVGASWCNEAILDLTAGIDGVSLTASTQGSSGPCTDLPFGGFFNLDDLGLTFSTTAGGVVEWELFEDFDDNINTADATYTSGLLRLYLCPTGQTLLPVNLISFSAKARDKDIQLEWVTSAEENNEGFSIERSTSGAAWQQVAWVPGNGGQQVEQSYSFSDQGVIPGATYYYRLKQMDFDQSFNYSEVVEAQLLYTLEDGVFLGNVFPNPATSVQPAKVEVFTKDATTAEIFITNFAGQRLRNQRVALTAGTNNLELNTMGLPAGLYLVSVNMGSKMLQRKFEVQR